MFLNDISIHTHAHNTHTDAPAYKQTLTTKIASRADLVVCGMATIPEALKVLHPLTSQTKVREALKVRLQINVCTSTQLTDLGPEAL